MAAQPLPLFSVVVPFLNEERWLEKCLAALAAQTLDASLFELLFIDNGSKDRSAEIVTRSGRATLLHEEKKDPYIARNRGIAAARGEYIVFLDADCLAAPDWLAELKAEIDRSHADIVLGYLAHPAGPTSLLHHYESYYNYKLRYLLKRNLDVYYFGHAGNMAVRRTIFEELGPFLPMPVVGDTEIIHRAIVRRPGTTIQYAPQARVVHAEVTSFSVMLHKMYECGAYSETFTGVSRYRTVPFAVRWKILRGFTREEGLGLATRAGIVASLGLGWLSFVAGRVRAAVSSS